MRQDGGPAFPRTASEGGGENEYGEQEGMSLRDWFAGMALGGWLADGSTGTIESAKSAYEYADAMLEARLG